MLQLRTFVTLSCLLAVVACGDDDDDDGAGPSGAPSPTATAAPTATASGTPSTSPNPSPSPSPSAGPVLLDCGVERTCTRVDVSASATWDGSDYSDDLKCVFEALRDVSSASGTVFLEMGTNLFFDSPNYANAWIEPDGSVLFQERRCLNGEGCTTQAPQRCTVQAPAYFTGCLDTPDLDCIDIAAMFEGLQRRRGGDLSVMRGIAVLTLLLASGACSYDAYRPDAAKPAPPPPASELYSFDPASAPPPVLLQEPHPDEYSVMRLMLPEREGTFFESDGATAVEYLPRNVEGTPPGVILVPIQGGDYDVTRYFAEYFAEKGVAALRIERRAEWLVAERSNTELSGLLQEFVIDVRRALYWWRSSGRVDADRVGLFGISMGAIMGTVVAATERDSLHRVVLALGGRRSRRLSVTATTRS